MAKPAIPLRHAAPGERAQHRQTEGWCRVSDAGNAASEQQRLKGARLAEIEAGALAFTRGEPGAVIEVRLPDYPRLRNTTSGYFKDFRKLAEAIWNVGRGKLYIT